MPLQTNRNCATGVLEDYSGGPLKYGRLLCDGSSYLTTTYPQLFAQIGYTYGGSGGNFNVPDIRGRATAGQDSNPGSGFANRLTAGGSGINSQNLGAAGGEEVETLTGAQSGLPAHSITTGGQSADHTHTIGVAMGDTTTGTNVDRRYNSAINDVFASPPAGSSNGTSNDHTHTASVSAQNAVSAHQVTQPTLVVIKTIMYA